MIVGMMVVMEVGVISEIDPVHLNLYKIHLDMINVLVSHNHWDQSVPLRITLGTLNSLLPTPNYYWDHLCH